MEHLVNKIRNCTACKSSLPFEPKPIVQLHSHSKIIIISQAPSRRVYETGIPWNDASGVTLRGWLDVDEATFYNPAIFSLIPLGFCYPGKGSSGDLPPRPECRPLWHSLIFQKLKSTPLILLVGHHAQKYYLKNKKNLTETVRSYKTYLPQYFVLPHPSPRNQNWLKMNIWFEEKVLPDLKKHVKMIISQEK